MILIDSVYINNGGGLILLKYLVDKLKKRSDVFYLFDKRTTHIFDKYCLNDATFISNSLYERHFFYLANKAKINKVFCFGNVPPTLKINGKVFVYFHQKLFLSLPKNFSIKSKLTYFFKQKILFFLKNNTDFWFVQSSSIATNLSDKYKLSREKIVVIPFYPPLTKAKLIVERKKGNFLYVSNSSPHKNHYRLIESFCLAYDEIHEGSLTVTVPSTDLNLCAFIQKKIDLGYPIANAGFIDREKLTELYLAHEYFIFPSLAESFGLGLAEAIDSGCKIIASDLSYTYEVCEPSLVFDPNSIDSIRIAIVTAIQNELPCAKKLIENDLSKIIQLLVD